MKIFFILSLCILLASCVSSKLATTPVGIWEYSIKDTPDGDFSGDLIVALNEDKKHTAVLKSSLGSISLNDPTFNKAEKKLNGTFDYQGNVVFFESVTEGDSMNGTVSVGGMNFPFKATRKK